MAKKSNFGDFHHFLASHAQVLANMEGYEGGRVKNLKTIKKFNILSLKCAKLEHTTPTQLEDTVKTKMTKNAHFWRFLTASSLIYVTICRFTMRC